jgi:hypothetical protein
VTSSPVFGCSENYGDVLVKYNDESTIITTFNLRSDRLRRDLRKLLQSTHHIVLSLTVALDEMAFGPNAASVSLEPRLQTLVTAYKECESCFVVLADETAASTAICSLSAPRSTAMVLPLASGLAVLDLSLRESSDIQLYNATTNELIGIADY